MELRELNDNDNDALAGTIKSVVSLLPILGGYISEIVNDIIPNQRIDRIANYCKFLKSELDKIPIDKLNKLLQNEAVIDLIEEGFTQASRAISDDRKIYISKLVSVGIENNDDEIVKCKFILNLLKELNDSEIVILNYLFYKYNKEKRDELLIVNKELLAEKYLFENTEKNHLDVAFDTSYRDHLERLGLIQYEAEKDRITKNVIFLNNGRPKIKGSEVTPLGGYMLNLIGLTDSIFPFSEHLKTEDKRLKNLVIQDSNRLLQTTITETKLSLQLKILTNYKKISQKDSLGINCDFLKKITDKVIISDEDVNVAVLENFIQRMEKHF